MCSAHGQNYYVFCTPPALYLWACVARRRLRRRRPGKKIEAGPLTGEAKLFMATRYFHFTKNATILDFCWKMGIWVKLKWNRWLKSLKNVKKWNYLFVFFRQNKQSDANYWECLFWLSHVKKLRKFASKCLFQCPISKKYTSNSRENLIKPFFTAENAFSSKDAHFSAIRSKNQSGNPTEKERYTSQSWE